MPMVQLSDNMNKRSELIVERVSIRDLSERWIFKIAMPRGAIDLWQNIRMHECFSTSGLSLSQVIAIWCNLFSSTQVQNY